MKRKLFDPYKSWAIVVYLRMSSKSQNSRSPDQQLETIKDTCRRLNYPWRIAKVYRDDAISGRLTKKRPGLQQMLSDLKSKKVKASLVLVDTFERLTRAEDGAGLRQQFKKLGMLVLTADSQFSDPTTPAGTALSAIEQIRSSDDGRIKAHNVLRGKKDAVKRKQWPGGSPPFGYMLRSVMVTKNGVTEISHKVLVPDPATKNIVVKIFRLAMELGPKSTAITKVLNVDPAIPDNLKPIYPGTVANILDNEIYKGDMVWGQHWTDIVNDVRIVEPQDEAEWVREPEFCEPLVSRQDWDSIQQVRSLRRKPRQDSEALESPVACTTPVSLKYLLSGLVVCDQCGRSMVAARGVEYTTKAGVHRHYASYGCASSYHGVCTNSGRVPEEWLRDTIVNLMRRRLFLTDLPSSGPGTMTCADAEGTTSADAGRHALRHNSAFAQFVSAVQEELERAMPDSNDRREALRSEERHLAAQCGGWSQSLSDRDLHPALRTDLQQQYGKASDRRKAIEEELANACSRASQIHAAVDPERVLDHLLSLSTVLASQNCSLGNVLLSQHVDSIRCNADGKVVVRTCKLGAMAGALELIPRTAATPSELPEVSSACTPRRRTRRHLGVSMEDEQAEAMNDFAVNPSRFAGLGPEWFTVDEFQVPRPISWAKENAQAVADYRLQTAASMEVTATHFGKTSPTIRAALRYASDLFEINALGKGVSRATLPNWSRANAVAVAQFFAQAGTSMKQAVDFFQKSEPTIRKALKIAQASKSPADGPAASAETPDASGSQDSALNPETSKTIAG